MDLTFKPSSSVALVFLLFFSILEASENKLFQIIQRIKSKNPSLCHLVSYRLVNDTFKVVCIDRRFNKYLYQIPITVDVGSSFLIFEDHFMDIENGMDSIYLKGLYLGRSIKNNSLNKSNLAFNNDNTTHPILKKNKMTLQILDVENAPELVPNIRVGIDHIKNFNEDPGLFTTRVIDCHLDAYVKISEGKSFKEMENNYGPPGDLIPITRKSILYQYRDFICGEKEVSKNAIEEDVE